MGTSIFLIFIIPFAIIYGLFGHLFTAIFGEPQTEIVLPYDESKGIVWEYDNKEDYYIDLVETKIKDNEQIFVFQDNDVDTATDSVGRFMDLDFTDKNGNQKIYYADVTDFKGPAIYEESECLIAEYTAVPVYPDESLHWAPSTKKDRILIQPKNYDTEVIFTVVCTPDDITKMTSEEQYNFTPIFNYENEDGAFHESVSVEYVIIDGKLVVEHESRHIPIYE